VLEAVLPVSGPRGHTGRHTISRTPINLVAFSAPAPPSPHKLSLTTPTSHCDISF
jgi:hypothetical protein